MSEYVKKGPMGYKLVQKYEATHVILTIEEHERLLQEIARAKGETTKVQDEVRRARQEMESAVWRARSSAEQEIAEIKAERDEIQKALEDQRGLNRNLLRTAKERANADRGLRPKKQHTGYVVTASKEREYRYRERGGDQHMVLLWETVLQSPYSVELTAEYAKPQIEEDLFQDSEDGWLIEKVGISGNCPEGYRAMLEDPEWGEYEQYNVMLERFLRANYRAGYWELSFIHTKPLSTVPSEMRAGSAVSGAGK